MVSSVSGPEHQCWVVGCVGEGGKGPEILEHRGCEEASADACYCATVRANDTSVKIQCVPILATTGVPGKFLEMTSVWGVDPGNPWWWEDPRC